MWLGDAILDSKDREYFHYQRKFYGWDRFAEPVYTAYHLAVFFYPFGIGREIKPQPIWKCLLMRSEYWLSVYVIGYIYSTSHFNFLQSKENNNLDSLKNGVQGIFLEWRLWSYLYCWHFMVVPQDRFLSELLLVWLYLILCKMYFLGRLY